MLPQQQQPQQQQQNEDLHLPDVYAISLQEIVPLNAVNILVSASETLAAMESWTQVFLDILNANEESVVFSLLDRAAVVGTCLIVFVRSQHLLDAQAIDMDTVLSSSLNLGQFYTGNKAAVAVRVRVYDRTLCFVSVHFCAHRGTTAALTRTEHMTYTVQQLAFYGCVKTQRPEYRSVCSGTEEALLLGQESVVMPASLEVGDHDLVVLMGDLNSRMLENINHERVWSIVNAWGGTASGVGVDHAGAAETMMSWDELWSEPMASTLRNLRFQEGRVTFAPTYKLTPGSSKYHVPSTEKPKKVFNHCPAWCDRVLYAVRSGVGCTQSEYMSAPIFMSDHLPVYSVFELEKVKSSEEGGGSGSGSGSGGKESKASEVRTEEARVKSLKFVRMKSANHGMCGGGECNVM